MYSSFGSSISCLLDSHTNWKNVQSGAICQIFGWLIWRYRFKCSNLETSSDILWFPKKILIWYSGGLQVTIVIYISEIANDSIRGRLGTFASSARNVGVLIIFFVAPNVNYHQIPCIFVIIPILFLVCFSLFPNTPQFHLQREQLQVW